MITAPHEKKVKATVEQPLEDLSLSGVNDYRPIRRGSVRRFARLGQENNSASTPLARKIAQPECCIKKVKGKSPNEPPVMTLITPGVTRPSSPAAVSLFRRDTTRAVSTNEKGRSSGPPRSGLDAKTRNASCEAASTPGRLHATCVLSISSAISSTEVVTDLSGRQTGGSNIGPCKRPNTCLKGRL